METKYLFTILIVGAILIFSLIAAQGSQEKQQPTNPITSFYDIKAKSIFFSRSIFKILDSGS